MSHILMVHVPVRSRDNLHLGLSVGRWAFPSNVRSPDLDGLAVGDFVFLGLGGKPRNGGGFEAWEQRSLLEAHLARVTREPFESTTPFWLDERRHGVVRWNPTIEIEYLESLGEVPLRAGAALSWRATDALYRGGVSHQAELIPASEALPSADFLAASLAPPRPRRAQAAASRLVAVESRRVRTLVRARPETVAEPVESSLLYDYMDRLRAAGDRLRRLAIPDGRGGTLYSDLFNETRGALVEAKGRTTREHVRMAIGQVLDYGRDWRVRRRAILVPNRPQDDLLRLLASVGIDAVWREGSEFVDTAGGALV